MNGCACRQLRLKEQLVPCLPHLLMQGLFTMFILGPAIQHCISYHLFCLQISNSYSINPTTPLKLLDLPTKTLAMIFKECFTNAAIKVEHDWACPRTQFHGQQICLQPTIQLMLISKRFAELTVPEFFENDIFHHMKYTYSLIQGKHLSAATRFIHLSGNECFLRMFVGEWKTRQDPTRLCEASS